MDPKEQKSTDPEQPRVAENDISEGVYLVNDDGTPFDSSDRTYVSVDLDEAEKSAEPGTTTNEQA